MAKWRNKTKRSFRKKKVNNLVKLAYQLGQIDRGMKNPNGSQVLDAYNRGLNKPVREPKKTIL